MSIRWLFCCMVVALSLRAEEIDLSLYDYERSFYSQNGEDGVLAKLFQLIKPENRFCVDIGAYDGMTGSNTYLLRLQGWDIISFDRSCEVPELNVFKEFISTANINQVFDRYGVPEEFGLLSIDIDYNDFYVWKAINQKYRPAVVVIEYNATHLPEEDKVVQHRPFFSGDGTNYFGASILAYYNLGRSKGYSLVYAEKAGVNLFFVRDDLIEKNGLQFKNMNNVAKIYQYPKYGQGPNGGHPRDPKEREYLSSYELLKN